MDVLTIAAPAPQTISIRAAKEDLIAAPTRDQCVIAGIATEILTNAVPALQAIGVIAARK